jgi:hypothetical protein
VLQQQLDRGSLAGNVSVVDTQGYLKRPSPPARGGARVDSPVADVDACEECPPCRPGEDTGFRDQQRRCRNCSATFFAAAADEHGATTALGVASFCSNDCMWSFSLRAEDGD